MSTEPPPEFLLRVERDRLYHQLAEARREIERLQMLLRLAEDAIRAEYLLRVTGAEPRPATAPATQAAPRS